MRAPRSRSVRFGKRDNQLVTLTVQGQAHAVSAMDLVVVLDATGSMGDEMDYLKVELDAIIARMKREAGNLDLRIGLVVYRDQGDDYVTRSFPWLLDIASVRASLARQEANGGGDTPEALDRALIAAEDMQWRPNAAKALLLIADAPPHENALGTTLRTTQRLRLAGASRSCRLRRAEWKTRPNM